MTRLESAARYVIALVSSYLDDGERAKAPPELDWRVEISAALLALDDELEERLSDREALEAIARILRGAVGTDAAKVGTASRVARRQLESRRAASGVVRPLRIGRRGDAATRPAQDSEPPRSEPAARAVALRRLPRRAPERGARMSAEPCEHQRFAAQVDVNRIEDRPGFLWVDLSVRCTECGRSVIFTGLERGISGETPTISRIDGTVASLPAFVHGQRPESTPPGFKVSGPSIEPETPS